MNQPSRDIQRAELPNGAVIVTEKMPQVRSVSVGIWLGTGSRSETPGRNGIAHFIEHMVFKGTRKRTAEEIAQSVDSVGGMLDAFTGQGNDLLQRESTRRTSARRRGRAV